MFQDISRQRQFACFVCNQVFDTYPEFKQHILDSHEEAREYVVCPLEYCKAPVRDLRFHFKDKHPFCKLPKTCQLRATVWIDQKTKKKKPNFMEGYYVSKKNGDKPLHYRSGYELRVYKILESLGEISAYHVEPFSIPYFFSGKQKSYIPDLLVIYADSHQELWEIKPANQKHVKQNQSKWGAATNYCLNRGINFKVITEQEISQLHGQVIQQLRD